MPDGSGAGPADVALGKQIVDRLRRRKLPQMVDWFDPGLLAKVGVRSIISATLGQYTDQRLMQAASDHVISEDELAGRYDYCGAGAAAAMEPDENGAIWVDYIADLGDGFEATYAMAYLMAPEYLEIPALDGSGAPLRLKAGELLVMGGDQVYPDATKQEYQNRLLDPYEWAFSTENPRRKLFVIPGNHDWYDGLSSFSALFCSARDRISRGLGKQIGGWRCHQHRSYFAIKLPHDWWIWGPDIQLADNLDDSQRDYFDLMSEKSKPGDKIILCLAEPSWLHKNYDNMHEISMLARKNGAKICAIIAGDWHHYSRYTSAKLGVQFITCGGGGAFAHATHGLKPRVTLNWAEPTGANTRTASLDDTLEFNRMEQAAVKPKEKDFTEKQYDISADAPADASPGEGAGGGRRTRAVRAEEMSISRYVCHVPHIYPTQLKSRLLCLKNLALPFRNRWFALLVGIVYLVYAWAFAAADPRQSPIVKGLAGPAMTEAEAAAGLAATTERHAKLLAERVLALSSDPTALPGAIKEAEEDKARAALTATRTADLAKAVKARATVLAGKSTAELYENLERIDWSKGVPAAIGEGFGFYKAWLWSRLDDQLSLRGLFDAVIASPPFFFLLLGLWVGLVYYVELPGGWLGLIGKGAIGTLHFAAHLYALLWVSWLAVAAAGPLKAVLQAGPAKDSLTPEVVSVVFILLTSVVVGGLLGAFIMGLYWTLTSGLANMHTGDAFGALGIKDYKSFLRIKLEPERATIYAVALDKVPGRKGWRSPEPGEPRPAHNPQIVPIKPLAPRLIEPPIVVNAADIK